MSHTDVNSVLLEPSKKDAATEIKLIKDIYYWDSSIESLANWIMASLWTAVNTKSQTEGNDYVFKYKDLVLHITLNKEYSLLIYGAKKILFILLVYM